MAGLGTNEIQNLKQITSAEFVKQRVGFIFRGL